MSRIVDISWAAHLAFILQLYYTPKHFWCTSPCKSSPNLSVIVWEQIKEQVLSRFVRRSTNLKLSASHNHRCFKKGFGPSQLFVEPWKALNGSISAIVFNGEVHLLKSSYFFQLQKAAEMLAAQSKCEVSYAEVIESLWCLYNHAKSLSCFGICPACQWAKRKKRIRDYSSPKLIPSPKSKNPNPPTPTAK